MYKYEWLARIFLDPFDFVLLNHGFGILCFRTSALILGGVYLSYSLFMSQRMMFVIHPFGCFCCVK